MRLWHSGNATIFFFPEKKKGERKSERMRKSPRCQTHISRQRSLVPTANESRKSEQKAIRGISDLCLDCLRGRNDSVKNCSETRKRDKKCRGSMERSHCFQWDEKGNSVNALIEKKIAENDTDKASLLFPPRCEKMYLHFLCREIYRLNVFLFFPRSPIRETRCGHKFGLNSSTHSVCGHLLEKKRPSPSLLSSPGPKDEGL